MATAAAEKAAQPDPRAATANKRDALGAALLARAEEVAQRVPARAFPGIEVDPSAFFTSAMATRLIGRYLMNSEAANEDEHETLARNGDSPLMGGADLADLTKAYLAWRDVLCEVIREECGRLRVPSEVVKEALSAVRLSCDASLVRMGRRFDLTRKQLEALVQEERSRLVHSALHDRLTGLPNRVRFVDALGATLSDNSAGEEVVVLFVDLDHFKSVNDQFGHRVGDELLAAVGKRLSRVARRSDMVARLGGDEFVMMVRGLRHPETDGPKMAERVRRELARPFRLPGRYLKITASVGLSPSLGAGADAVVTQADQAMYEAKRLGRNRVSVYDEVLGAVSEHRSSLAQDLHFALQRGQLEVIFQPICDLDGAVTAAEALLRWHHPRLGSIPPSEFIPLAEQTGEIKAIGKWVLEEAAQACVGWRRAGVTHATVSVNVSTFQLESLFPGQVETVLRQARLPSSALKLEITESALLPDAPDSADVIRRLADMGVGLEIDDFGTGYSSLAYLHRLPVQALKIDRSFVSGVGRAQGDSSILRAMVDLAHNLGLGVIAEGVEEEPDLEVLRAMGCDRVQGYLLGRPVPASEIEWLSGYLSNRPVASALRSS